MTTIGLVAHDQMKLDIVEWCVKHKEALKKFRLLGTEGTAKRIGDVTGLAIGSIGHGADGGDIHIAYNILEGNIDILIFFVDTKTAHGHEHDIQTLIRTCTTQNILFALNKATADFFLQDA